MRVCSIEGCERRHLAKGYCGKHYQRMVAHGSPDAEVQARERGRTCSIDGCDQPHSGRGYCNSHYMRFLRYGDPERVVQLRGPDEERFWAKVDKAGQDDCWHWRAKKGLNQYGHFRSTHLKRSLGAHAFSFFLANDYVPPEVMHTCDVRSCVNPRHLRAGTRKLNMADMIAKGRAPKIERPKGVEHHAAKLTEDDVRAIRASKDTHRVVAARYGLAKGTVASIRARRSWTHVT